MQSKSPRAKRHARTREAILDAALQIVTESGKDALSIREIAGRIDYSPSGLYEYFASKEEIIEALVGEGFARLTVCLIHEVQGETAAARLLAANRAYLKFAQQEPQLYLLMFTCTPSQSVSYAELSGDSAYSKLLQILREGVQSGEFQSSTAAGPEELTYTSWAFIHGLAMLQLTLMRNSPEDIDALHERALQAFVERLQ
ncbi:MAG TPA: TetR/AcrR family transcriptional regulator [Ktedonobacteraceae bacterium]|jgi:AcrR family transcriptional regulator|nr:TetR/AcrR family transcriptional regulator [Ktedonobacteraceae bacterium]